MSSLNVLNPFLDCDDMMRPSLFLSVANTSLWAICFSCLMLLDLWISL